MKEQFVPYAESRVLGDIGFDEICLAAYCDPDFKFVWQLKGWYKHNYLSLKNAKYRSPEGEFCTAPLYQQAFEWFRTEHNLYHNIYVLPSDHWNISINQGRKKMSNVFDSITVGTYESAELDCLRELTKIVLDRQLVTLYKETKKKQDENNK